MPDLVPDERALHRSRRRFRFIVAATAVAIVLAGAAFYVALRLDWSAARAATARADRAAIVALAATREAKTAAAHAEQAHDAAQAAIGDLCRFLDDARRPAGHRDEDEDEARLAAEAGRLFTVYHCPQVLR